jgi:superfamily II DNA/RNA helicase
MSRFKNKSLKILIGTDIISRGIDVVGIELVINYDTPNDPEDYVHRVGRTARADSNGEAITFVSDKDQYKLSRIEQMIGMEIEKFPLPEGFQSGPDYKSKSHHPEKPGDFKGKKSFSKNSKKKKNFKPRDNQNPESKEKSTVKPSEQKQEARPPREKSPDANKEKNTPFGKRTNVVD